MTNATNPTVQGLKLLGGLVVITVDQFGSVQPLNSTTFVSANGTNFGPMKDSKAGGNYTVPAASNLQIWGFEICNFTYGGSAAVTLLQFGYADDASGTNFVLQFDILNGILNGIGTSTSNNSNQITGKLTVPTGKIPQLKMTSTTTNNTIVVKIIGLVTN